MNGPIFSELVCRLGNAGPQWRPTADKITEELVTYMRTLYPNAPSRVPEDYARAMVTRALQVAAQTRASGSDYVA